MTKFSGVFFHETAKIRDNKYIIAYYYYYYYYYYYETNN